MNSNSNNDKDFMEFCNLFPSITNLPKYMYGNYKLDDKKIQKVSFILQNVSLAHKFYL
jgi:hypothetical protein